MATRYGGGAHGRRRARAAALLLLALPGTAFVYEGQELGLDEVDVPDDARQDPIFSRTNGERLGRDGCRVPIPWSGDAPPFGFTSGTPWLPMPPDWTALTVEAQARDPRSTLSLYKSALALRRTHPALQTGSFEWRDGPPGTIVFARAGGRETIVCAVNVGTETVELPQGELLLTSDGGENAALPCDTAAWLREERKR